MVSFLGRLFGGKKARFESPEYQAEQLEWLREDIRLHVATGYADEAEILQNARDCFEGEIEPSSLERESRRLLAEALAEHAEQQRTWPATTDCDRLDAAFAALEAQGIMSRQNYSCCQTCGTGEIYAEMKAAEQSGKPVQGYSFFHVQDTESAVEGGGVFLSYGGYAKGDQPTMTVADKIVSTLADHGLKTDWDGKLETRIFVEMDWKRRRPAAVA
jgi:hypothetical protein